MVRSMLLVLLMCSGVADSAGERAHFNYMIHCQGCHLPHAAGFPPEVPRINGFIGYYLHSDAGRRFIIQVPGVATSQLSDEEIAEMMNWLLDTYSVPERPADFIPYTPAEVSTLRTTPESDPLNVRSKILQDIAKANPGLRHLLPTVSAYDGIPYAGPGPDKQKTE